MSLVKIWWLYTIAAVLVMTAACAYPVDAKHVSADVKGGMDRCSSTGGIVHVYGAFNPFDNGEMSVVVKCMWVFK